MELGGETCSILCLREGNEKLGGEGGEAEAGGGGGRRGRQEGRKEKEDEALEVVRLTLEIGF
eukprot:1014465-Pyramimonas_sp.AAC.1